MSIYYIWNVLSCSRVGQHIALFHEMQFKLHRTKLNLVIYGFDLKPFKIKKEGGKIELQILLKLSCEVSIEITLLNHFHFKKKKLFVLIK